ncbi:MAG: C2H2-type zinc finger protein [Vicinamibacterales bacterium]
MSSNDPGNAGGSVVIPPSPVPPSRTEYPCEICRQVFDSLGELEAHRATHLGPHPVLLCVGRPVASEWLITDAAQLDDIEAQDTSWIEAHGQRLSARALKKQLLQLNAQRPLQVILVGRKGDVRQTYTVRVAIFEEQWLESVDSTYLREFNAEGVAKGALIGLCQGRPWSDRPERAYAEALAAFRLAFLMRDELFTVTRHAPESERSATYKVHLADAREILRLVNRPVALTAMAAAAFVENDFSKAPGRIIDRALERSIRLFRHLTAGAPPGPAIRKSNGVTLALDANTRALLTTVERLDLADAEEADRMLAGLCVRTREVGDVENAKKAMALALHCGLLCGDHTLLMGDPVFARFLKERLG